MPLDAMEGVVDYTLVVKSAQNLPKTDLFTSCDPYVVVEILPSTGGSIVLRTKALKNTLQPVWDAKFNLAGIPPNTVVLLSLHDKDVFQDDCVAEVKFDLVPTGAAGEVLQVALPLLKCGSQYLSLLQAAGLAGKAHVPQLNLEVSWCKSHSKGLPRFVGPIRYSRLTSHVGGAFTGSKDSDHKGLAFYLYKLYIPNVSEAFKGVKQGWNRDYHAAKQIFGPMAIVTRNTIKLQHKTLYSQSLVTEDGDLNNGEDFLRLVHNGERDGQLRYFTYVLLEDSMRFSETGTAFFTDMLSKHALHSGAAESVFYAGEFCVVTDEGSPFLLLDNNSGTYSPAEEQLENAAALLRQFLPGLDVRTMSHRDQRLKDYHSKCPSRQ